MKEPLVYIVDPNRSFRNIVTNCLKAIKIKNIEQYENGESCYLSKIHLADIIVLDYFLGEDAWNGIDFMTEYKRVSPNTNFIFMSSETDLKKAVEAIRKGALDYILKSKKSMLRLAKRAEITRKTLGIRS